MVRERTMSGPLKLRARERLCSCSSCQSQAHGLPEGETDPRHIHQEVEHEELYIGGVHADAGPESTSAHVDIVSTSTSASPISSPRTDEEAETQQLHESGKPQHIVVDELYWSPFSGPAVTPYSSPFCPPEEIEPSLVMRMGDKASEEEWKEEFCLPPGLFSPSADELAGPEGGSLFGEQEMMIDYGFGPDLSMLMFPGMADMTMGRDCDMGMYMTAGCEADYGMSQLDAAAAAAQMEAYLQWHRQDPQTMGQEMWADPLMERLHFDKLTRSAFGTTGGAIAGEEISETEAALRTTVMIRNLPTTYNREHLLELLDAEGFAGRYDFVYLPIDFTSAANLGYAFIDLVTPADAHTFMEQFSGFSSWNVAGAEHTGSDKSCVVSWSSPHQGLAQHVERYRSSPVMHPNIPEDWKPLIFLNGLRVAFPPPTKHIKAPKVRCRPEAKAEALKNQQAAALSLSSLSGPSTATSTPTLSSTEAPLLGATAVV